MNDYLRTLDQQIEQKHLLKHPFYLAWTGGELSKEALQDYAAQYYQHVAAFPTYLSAVHSRCQDQATRKLLLQNLIDEEAGTPNHPELWLQFAEAIGVSPEDVRMTAAQAETAHLVSTFRAICSEASTAAGLAALYAYESQIPSICESKIDGLKKHYGMSNPEHYRYFSVHIDADREHAAAERDLLNKHVTVENVPAVRRSVAKILNALWNLLSGVCQRHGIEMECVAPAAT